MAQKSRNAGGDKFTTESLHFSQKKSLRGVYLVGGCVSLSLSRAQRPIGEMQERCIPKISSGQNIRKNGRYITRCVVSLRSAVTRPPSVRENIL